MAFHIKCQLLLLAWDLRCRRGGNKKSFHFQTRIWRERLLLLRGRRKWKSSRRCGFILERFSSWCFSGCFSTTILTKEMNRRYSRLLLLTSAPHMHQLHSAQIAVMLTLRQYWVIYTFLYNVMSRSTEYGAHTGVEVERTG